MECPKTQLSELIDAASLQELIECQRNLDNARIEMGKLLCHLRERSEGRFEVMLNILYDEGIIKFRRSTAYLYMDMYQRSHIQGVEKLSLRTYQNITALPDEEIERIIDRNEFETVTGDTARAYMLCPRHVRDIWLDGTLSDSALKEFSRLYMQIDEEVREKVVEWRVYMPHTLQWINVQYRKQTGTWHELLRNFGVFALDEDIIPIAEANTTQLDMYVQQRRMEHVADAHARKLPPASYEVNALIYDPNVGEFGALILLEPLDVSALSKQIRLKIIVEE